MATVIDELIVVLGLDPSKFSSGVKKAADDLDKFKRGTADQTKDIEFSGKRMSSVFGDIQAAVISLYAVFTAGRGLKEFIADTVTSNAALGRMAYTLNTSVDMLARLGGAARLAGGSAAGLAGSWQNFTQQFEMAVVSGRGGPLLGTLRALFAGSTFAAQGNALGILDNNNKMLPAEESLRRISKELAGIAKTDPARAFLFGTQLGFDAETTRMLVRGPEYLDALIKMMQKYGFETKADTDAAAALSLSWIGLELSSTHLGTSILTRLTPALVAVTNAMTGVSEWIGAHPMLGDALFAGLITATSALTLGMVALSVSFAVAAAGGMVVVGPILLIIAALTALAAAAVWFTEMWNTTNADNTTSFGAFKKTVLDGVDALTSLFVGTAPQIRAAWSRLWTDISNDLENSDFFQFMIDPAGFIGRYIAKNAVGYVAMNATAFKTGWNATHDQLRRTVDAIAGTNFSGTNGGGGGDGSKPVGGVTGGLATLFRGGGNRNEDAWKAARATEAKYGIPAEVTYAQWQLESASGTKMPPGSNNPFGIKAVGNQPYVAAMTTEIVNGQAVRVMQRFAKYASIAEAFEAHARLLATSSKYAAARAHENDPNAFADALTGVYATDMEYGKKLRAIMAQNSAPNIPASGAPSAATASNLTNYATVNGPTSNNAEAHVGQITIHTQAQDVHSIAQDIAGAINGAMKTSTLAAQGQAGFSG